VLSSFAYVSIQTKKVKNQVTEKLQSKGYKDKDILKFDVEHSFFKALVYHKGWSINIEYSDEPGVLYFYSIENNEIIGIGVSGKIPDKNKVKHADELIK
jgi:hypothetical protein